MDGAVDFFRFSTAPWYLIVGIVVALLLLVSTRRQGRLANRLAVAGVLVVAWPGAVTVAVVCAVSPRVRAWLTRYITTGRFGVRRGRD